MNSPGGTPGLGEGQGACSSPSPLYPPSASPSQHLHLRRTAGAVQVSGRWCPSSERDRSAASVWKVPFAWRAIRMPREPAARAIIEKSAQPPLSWVGGEPLRCAPGCSARVPGGKGGGHVMARPPTPWLEAGTASSESYRSSASVWKILLRSGRFGCRAKRRLAPSLRRARNRRFRGWGVSPSAALRGAPRGFQGERGAGT